MGLGPEAARLNYYTDYNMICPSFCVCVCTSICLFPNLFMPMHTYAQYPKKCLSNQFEILQVYWYISVGGRVWLWTRSKIQYGCQVAILDFYFCSISQEAFEQSIWNFAGVLVHIRGRLSSILDPIRNPIWPPGGHLGFSFPLNISRSVWAIDLKFGTFIDTY